MFFEGGPQLVRMGGLGHFRQGLQDLLFGVVDVLQRIEKKFVEGLSQP
jgi:hypothetical protein